LIGVETACWIWGHWGWATVEEEGEQIDGIADVDGKVLIHICCVQATRWRPVAEEESQAKDTVPHIDRSIGIIVSSQEWSVFADIRNPIAIGVRHSFGDVALIGSVVRIAVLRDSEQNIAIIDDAVAVAVGLCRVFADIRYAIRVAVCRCATLDLALVGDRIGVAVLRDADDDVALIENTVAITIDRRVEFTLIGDLIAVAIGAGAAGKFAFIGNPVAVAVRCALADITVIGATVVIAVFFVAVHRAADKG
jgi:hypothetical protein